MDAHPEATDPSAVDVDAELARIEEQARGKRSWRVFVAGAVGGLGGAFLSSFGHSHHHHRVGRDSPVVYLAVAAVVIAAVVVGIVVARRRRRWLPPASLTAGLTPIQRKQVRSDLRRGRVADDPVLAEVERRTAVRVLHETRYQHLVTPVAAILLTVIVFLADYTSAGRAVGVLVTLLLIAMWPWQIRYRRRLRARLAQNPSADRRRNGR